MYKMRIMCIKAANTHRAVTAIHSLALFNFTTVRPSEEIPDNAIPVRRSCYDNFVAMFGLSFDDIPSTIRRDETDHKTTRKNYSKINSTT